MVNSGDIDIEVLTWGEVGKPGLLFTPGLQAHADWWTPIAPAFLPGHRIVAISMAGMGLSGWRERYTYMDYAEDLYRCALAGGLYEADDAPVYIGHSVGAWSVYYAALSKPDRMRAAVVIDMGVGKLSPKRGSEPSAPRIYDSLEEAVERFRFNSDEACDGHFLKTFIAARSLKAVLREDGREGWTWKSDPNALRKLDHRGFAELQGTRQVPTVHIYGQRSHMMEAGQQLPSLRPIMRGIPIPDAGHNVMIDQPEALVAALHQVLAGLPESCAPPQR